MVILFSCKTKEKIIANDLRLVTQQELIKNAEKRQSYNRDHVIFKNENGVKILADSAKNWSPNDWAMDYYVDGNNELKEVVFRKITEDDQLLVAKIKSIYHQETEDPVVPIDINCNTIQDILEDVYKVDQDTRANGQYGSPITDRENLVTVVSIIEKCGMPTLKSVNKKQMFTIWSVFQHGDSFNRNKYFPLLKQAQANGGLRKSHIALMQDRILMESNQPQIYGSQITDNNEDRSWMIYDLADPQRVDKRRAEVGLEPLSEYVKQWDIIFDIPQVE